MGATPSFDLYVDDSGSRHPDRTHNEHRRDGMDAFALGGLLIQSESATEVYGQIEALRDALGLDYPLHSTAIRCSKANFVWVGEDKERTEKLYEGLNSIFQNLPGLATAAIVHRPGYNDRYGIMYGEGRWLLCKTAYEILIDRCAKYALQHGRKLKVFIEQTGPLEDDYIRGYHRGLYEAGMSFDGDRSSKYAPLSAEQFQATLLKNPQFVKKSNPLAQAADLLLYPLIKGRYDPTYRPFLDLVKWNKIVDCTLPSELENCGVKYSCFDGDAFKESLFK